MGDEEESVEAEAESVGQRLEDIEIGTWNPSGKQTQIIQQLSDRLINGDLQSKIQSAREIRRHVRKSSASAKIRTHFAAAGVIQPLVFMLFSPNLEAREASLLALLNLAVRNERNKVKIVTAGAIPPLVDLLKVQSSMRELATAAILTLSAAAANKTTIAASGAAPLLIQILNSGSLQGRVDAVTALHNLSSCPENSTPFLDARAVPPLIHLLRECKKYSKFAEKATALLEILSNTEDGRIAISNADSGILTIVETVEDGSLVSTEHAVGTLLSLCLSCRDKYRELILNEGAIPGLLRLTVEGTAVSRDRAHALLDLLRESPPEKRISSAAMERIVYDIAARVDGVDKAAETAKRLLQDMAQRRADHSLRSVQDRTASHPPASDQASP